MGAKLQKAFEIAKKEGGMKAQMRLAMKGGISSDKAANTPDTPEQIKKFEAALKEILSKPITL